MTDPAQALAAAAKPAPRAGGASSRVLVLGGSQGARALNLAVPKAIAALPAGSLEVRRAMEVVAQHLGVSRATVYGDVM